MAWTAQDKKNIVFDPFSCVKKKKKKQPKSMGFLELWMAGLGLRECQKSSFVEYNQIYTLLFQRKKIRPLESNRRAAHLGTAQNTSLQLVM